MRVIADENFPAPIVARLRIAGHDVLWVAESMPGARDTAVLEKAQTESRLVITFDKDFGELAFKRRLPATCGIVLFRLTGTTPQIDNDRAFAALTARDDWAGHFSVITDERIRMRTLPVA